MDAISPTDPAETVVCKFASQAGKTEVLLNAIGYIIDQDPGPTLVIQPNVSPMGEAFAKDRIAPMIRDTQPLRGKVADPKSRSSGNTQLHKKFAGGAMTITGANSPAGLASRPIRYLLCDELDRWDVTKEGSPLALGRKRTRTFHNRKILIVSSPTFEGMGIDAEYEACDQQHEWHLICPDCGETQMPVLKHFKWKSDDPESAVYICVHCGVAHDAAHEDRIKARGRWICTKDEGQQRKGFWFNQWASPFTRWSETVAEFLDAKDDPAKLQTVVNTAFADCWHEIGDQADSEPLLARREIYPSDVPAGGVVLTAFVDVQDDRLEVQVDAFGEGEERWTVDYIILPGDTSQPDVWSDLDLIHSSTYIHESGAKLSILATGIDSGHRTQIVYDYVKRAGARIYATKGVDGMGRPLISAPVRKRTGRDKRRVDLYTIGVDEAKSLILHRLQIQSHGPGYWHFPSGHQQIGEEYFAQLTAERRVRKFKRGHLYHVWDKTRPRNEALDCAVGCMAMFRLLPRNIVQMSSESLSTKTAKPAPPQPPVAGGLGWINTGGSWL